MRGSRRAALRFRNRRNRRNRALALLENKSRNIYSSSLNKLHNQAELDLDDNLYISNSTYK